MPKFMTIAAKRKKLHDFIDTGDDQQVVALYNKIVGYIIGKSDASDSLIKMEKSEVMKQALNDPLLLADLKEVSDDFDPWEDDDFLKELKSRLDDIESGKVKGIPWEEVKRNAKERLAAKNRNA